MQFDPKFFLVISVSCPICPDGSGGLHRAREVTEGFA